VSSTIGSSRATTGTSTAAGRIGRTAAIAAAIGSRSWSPRAGTIFSSAMPAGTSRLSRARAREKKSVVTAAGEETMTNTYAEMPASVSPP
jgi:hypothetical protein